MPIYHLHLRRLCKDVFYVQGYYSLHINPSACSPFQYSAVAIVTILHDHTVSGDLTFNKSPKGQCLKNISRFVQKFCHDFSLEDWQVQGTFKQMPLFEDWIFHLLKCKLSASMGAQGANEGLGTGTTAQFIKYILKF